MPVRIRRSPAVGLILAAAGALAAPHGRPGGGAVPQRGKATAPKEDPEAHDLRGYGEEIFCRAIEQEGIGGSACRNGWRFAVSLTCGPVCRSYSAERQAAHQSHPAQYAAEECERRIDAACMSTCLAGQLLGNGQFDAQGKDAGDFMASFVFAASQASKREAVVWFQGLTDPLGAAARNASAVGNATVERAEERLQDFWETLCASGGETSYGTSLCADAYQGTAASASVHFEYLDKLRAKGDSFLQRARRGLRARALPTVRDFLSGRWDGEPERRESFSDAVAYDEPSVEASETGAATAAADAAFGFNLRRHSHEMSLTVVRPYGTSALRSASQVATRGGVPFVRRWVEASFLRECQRVASCSTGAVADRH